jgi:hypothetical protein
MFPAVSDNSLRKRHCVTPYATETAFRLYSLHVDNDSH